jgi:hypothetical protein
MSTYRHLRRADLFLVRVWVEDAAGDEEDAGERSDGSTQVAWCGRVQRVVDGEAHEFSGLQGLVDSLSAMLSTSEGR